jgi:hydrogenase expression/formation protein HypC
MCLAVPGQVLSINDDQFRMGTVSFGGVIKDISLALVPDAGVGDYVIVHVGFAICKLNEEAARRSLELLAELDRREGRGDGREAPRPS